MNAEPQEHQKLIRLGVVTYVVALLLIAAFSIAFHFIADSIVHRQQTTARIVNVSGRQRMLSQRIAKLSLDRAGHAPFRSDADTIRDLNTSINLMEASHSALLSGSTQLGPSPSSDPAVNAVYFDKPFQLDSRLKDFIVHARAVADHPASSLTMSDPDLAAVEQAAQEPLLTALNAAVQARESSSEHSIQSLRQTLAILTILMLLILLLEALFLYRPLFNRLGEAHQQLVIAGRTDPMTGSLNRRAFTQEAEVAIATARRKTLPLAVLMLDIDHFKSVNDTYGHPAGDRVINSIVELLLNQVRSADILCRMGGEEFAIMLPGDALAAAFLAAERFRTAIANQSVIIHVEAAEHLLPVTVSIGVAELAPDDTSLFSLLSRADRALYAAKQNGRNRTETELTMLTVNPLRPTLVAPAHTSRIRMVP